MTAVPLNLPKAVTRSPVPQLIVTPSHKILLLLHDCNFTVVGNCYVNMCCAGYGIFDPVGVLTHRSRTIVLEEGKLSVYKTTKGSKEGPLVTPCYLIFVMNLTINELFFVPSFSIEIAEEVE